MRESGNLNTTRSANSSTSGVTVMTRPQGLGTSKDSDARDYFSNMKKHTIAFSTVQGGDKELINLAFSKFKADDRKEWLRQFKVLDHRTTVFRLLTHDLSLVPISTTTLMKSRTVISSTRSSSFSRWQTMSGLSRPYVTVSNLVRGRLSGVASRGNSRRKSK
jgi:hypothetical protein